MKMPSGRRAGSLARLVLRIESGRERISSPSPAKHIESVGLNLFVVLAGMQRVEIRDAVEAEDDGLAIDDELLLPVLQRGLYDPRIALGPVITVAGDQPHTIAIAPQADTIAVILNFVALLGT